MPRKSLVEKEVLLKVLNEKLEEIIKNGRVIGPASEIWFDLQYKNNLPMTPKALYTFALKHFSNKTDVSKSLPNTPQNNDPTLNCDISDNDTLSSNSELSNNDDDNKFKIKIGKEKWELMKPSESVYKRRDERNRRSAVRNYLTMQPGVWTDLINEAIWNEKKYSCTLVYKRAKVGTELAETFLSIKAICKECKSSFHGSCPQEPTDNEDLVLTFTVRGDTDVPHNHGFKRKLSGKRRVDVVKTIIERNESVSKYRKLQARKDMELFDREPPHIPSLEVLRKAKSEAVTKQNIHGNLFTSLQLIQYSDPYKNAIKDIGLDKFWVHYWSADQLRLYNLYCSKTNVPTLFIDATGGVVKKIQRPAGNLSGHIFLYCGVIKVASRTENQLPIVCMLSERHHTNAITYWLKEWLRSGAQIPIQCITDLSLALLSAACSSFTKYSTIHEYINKCYDFLMTEVVEEDVPHCFIRVDVAHVLKLVSQWPSLKGKSRRIREFYIRSVGQLILSTSLDHARNIVCAILSVSLSETEGLSSRTSEPTVGESCKNWLKKIISSSDINVDYEPYVLVVDQISDIEMEDGEELPKEPEQCNKFSTWTKVILEECKRAVEGDSGNRDNLHYLPELNIPLLSMCEKLPLWTGIMIPIFGYGTKVGSSASVESYFKELKVNFMRKDERLRVDNFLMQHIKLNDGSLKIAGSTSMFQNETAENNGEIHEQVLEQERNESEFQQVNQSQQEKHIFTPLKNVSICMACSVGNNPEGAHKCIVCKRAVHALDGCSLPVGEEGYGQKRKCMSCAKSSNIAQAEAQNEIKKRNEWVKPVIQELKQVENWRNQATSSNCKKSFYLSPCPEIVHVEESATKNRLKVGLLKNGNCIKLKPRRVDKTQIVLENTCAFDSVAQGIAVCLCDSDNYSKLVNVRVGIVKLSFGLVQGLKPHQLYLQRISILKDKYPAENLQQSLTRIKCTTTVTDIVSKFVNASFSETKDCSSPFCPEKNTNKHFTLLRVDSQFLTENGITYLEEAVKRATCINEKRKCMKILHEPSAVPVNYKFHDPHLSSMELCNGNVSYNQEFGANGHLMIEVASDHQKQQPAQHDYELNAIYKLEQIPNNVNFSGKNFHLRSVIAFLPPLVTGGIGHYVAYCRRSDGGWEIYDDLREKVIRTNNNKSVCIHIVIYSL